MTIPTLPIDIDNLGVVGTRSLRALQLVRIGRHPSTTMLIPRDGIWVVSGRGPETGSNGAGKTVLLGAMSLLNGDPQWRGENGIGPNAARLLFDHNRARIADARYRDAPHGYIAGVYLHAGRLDDALTVWMRIERHSSTHILVRWSQSIRLARGDDEATRFEDANEIWSTLRDGETLRVSEYAERLYGKAPRCIAYIRARGSEDNQDRGLLALGQRPFRPTDLANQIITLAGKQNAVDNERQFRQELEAAESLLSSKKEAFEQQYRREEQELRDIADRKRARALLGDAAESWSMFLKLAALLAYQTAKELADTVKQLEDAIQYKETQIRAKSNQLSSLPPREELAGLFNEAKGVLGNATREKNTLIEESGANGERQKILKEEIAKLRTAVAVAPGLSVDAAEGALSSANIRRRSAEQKVGRLQELYDKAEERLEQLRAGRGGPAGKALDALNAEDISAVSILDLINLDEADRGYWEARLSPYVNAIVVARTDIDSARRIIAQHPGTPLIAIDSDATKIEATWPGDNGILVDLLHHLKDRMPEAGQDWVIDPMLGIEIPGGYEIPLTDRRAAINAAESRCADLEGQRNRAIHERSEAEKGVKEAENRLAAARAAIELTDAQPELEKLLDRARKLEGLIGEATAKESTAQEAVRVARANYDKADERRREISSELNDLKTGNGGIEELSQRAADAREKSRVQKEVVAQWQWVAGISNLEASERQLAERDIALRNTTRDEYYHHARTTLRQAVEAVLDPAAEAAAGSQRDAPASASGAQELHQRLNADLKGLHYWCDNPRVLTEPPRSFDIIAMPLNSWLDWNGADDVTREVEIYKDRVEHQRDVDAAEKQTSETRMWIKSQRDNQIAIITKAFQDTEKTLNELLAAVRQDPIALRHRYADLNDTNQPLRWEVHPQWVPPGRKPVDYSNPPNTAELIILHLLLATSSLVAAAKPQGRMLILDESGNNLDGPNLTRVSAVLQQVARSYGLTVVLACQDIYTDRVAHYGAGMIQLLRPSPRDPLNAAPDVSHEQEDPAVLEALMPYLNLGRPEQRGDAGTGC